jgi:hypothetical protein
VLLPKIKPNKVQIVPVNPYINVLFMMKDSHAHESHAPYLIRCTHDGVRSQGFFMEEFAANANVGEGLWPNDYAAT